MIGKPLPPIMILQSDDLKRSRLNSICLKEAMKDIGDAGVAFPVTILC